MTAGILHTSYIEIRKRPITETLRYYRQALEVGRLTHGLKRKG